MLEMLGEPEPRQCRVPGPDCLDDSPVIPDHLVGWPDLVEDGVVKLLEGSLEFFQQHGEHGVAQGTVEDTVELIVEVVPGPTAGRNLAPALKDLL